MTLKKRSDLQAYFQTGKIPTQDQFTDLINSMLNQADDKITAVSSSNKLKITIDGDLEVKGQFINDSPSTASDLAIGNSVPPTFAQNVTIGSSSPGKSANLTVNGALNVTGATSLGATLSVTGAATLSGGLTVTGAVKATTFDGALDASKVASGVLNVERIPSLTTAKITGLDTALAGKAATNGSENNDFSAKALTVKGALNVTGAATLSNNLAISGKASIGTPVSNYTLDIKASSGIKLGLEGNGGGQLILTNNSNDNSIYLEAFSKDGSGNANALFLTGRSDTSLPSLILRADKTFISGNLGIGVDTPNYKLEVAGDISVGKLTTTGFVAATYGAKLYFNGAPDNTDPLWMARYDEANDKTHLRINVGDEGVTGDQLQIGYTKGSSWTTSYYIDTNGNVGKPSDERLKTEVDPIPDALAKVKRMRGVQFLWKRHLENDIHPAQKSFGVLAQEVEAIVPNIVSTDQSGFKFINYDGIIPLLIESIKSQQAQIEELQAEARRLTLSLTPGKEK